MVRPYPFRLEVKGVVAVRRKRNWEEVTARKRAELKQSFEEGKIADPVTILISLAVSAAVTGAQYLLAKAFQPKQPTLQQGKLSGSLQLQNSEQGIFIPEIYGASPTVSITTGTSPTYQNVTNCTTGAGGAITKTSGGANVYDAGATHNVSITAGDAFFDVYPTYGGAAAGFCPNATITQAIDIPFGAQWQLDGALQAVINGLPVNVGTWTAGDKLRIEIKNGVYNLYKNSARLSGFLAPAVSYPLYFAVAMARTSSGVTSSKVQIGNIGNSPNAGRGGIKVPAIIVWTSGIRKNVTTTQQPTGGGKGGGSRSQTVENITYDIDLGLEWCRGPVNLLREFANADVIIDQVTTSALPSGIYDPAVGADATYDPTAPPNPVDNYITPIDRVDAAMAVDGAGVGSGTIQGGGSLFTIYPGSSTQDPDPTIEADIDAKYGAGSTPAYRNHSLIVHKTFQLSRWGGIVPNMTAVWEHQTLKTLDDIYGSLTERVGLTAGDYDFTSLSTVNCRGLSITGRLFSPAEILDDDAIQMAYSYFTTEAEGKIYGYLEGTEPTLTIADTEVGWLDGDGELPDVIPEVSSRIAQESTLARQVDVKFIDPDNQWDPNTQSAKRQITDGVSTELLEVQLCLLADEARAVAQRKLYRDYVAGTTHKFTLPWTYMYLYPGYKVTINRAEGFSHVIRLTSVTGGLGVLECEGVALEPEVYNQPATGAFNGLPEPNQQVPAMTVANLLDTPLLRDGDNNVNGGVGFYAGGAPRTGVNQNWQGWVLYVSKNNQWIPLGSSNLPATTGLIATASGSVSDPTVIDRVSTITVDLYGVDAILSSITEADANADPTKNIAVVGNEVIRFLTATQVGGYANRWQLSNFYRGQRGTDGQIGATLTGKRFVLINDAIIFVPMNIADVNSTRNYKMVTSGQTLGDAASVSFVWTGGALKTYSPVNARGIRDFNSSLLVEWTRRSRIGEGLRPLSDVPLAEEEEIYEMDVYSGGNVVRTLRVNPKDPEVPMWQMIYYATGAQA